MQLRVTLAILALSVDCAAALPAQTPMPTSPGRHRIEVRSSVDGSVQPSYLYLPPLPSRPGAQMPLAVMLHTWSFDLEQRDTTVEAEARARGWILLSPNFRGKNDHPEACGSRLAQQDILDAVASVRASYAVDARRIYVLGLSGGGYLTMLVAAKHPDLWAAASAWVGISDLREWYAAHGGDNYGRMMRACLGGAPEESDSIGAEYRDRSPITYLTPTVRVPLDIAAGRFDSTVAVSHSLRAFQAIAPSALSNREIESLVAPGPGLIAPAAADTASDRVLGRRVYLRRVAGPHRVTVFEGGHEWLPRAAIDWLAKQQKR
jgi:acetyl esterase/lipase